MKQIGLNEKQVAGLLQKFGYNEVAKKKKQSVVIKFLSYFKNPLIIVLLISAIISYISGEVRSAITILAMALLSVVFNFYQEHKSGKAAEEIAKKLALKCNVIRDGKEKEIEVKFIVPGDLVVLSAGDIIPADGVLVSSDDLFVNESALTGESFPVEKKAQEKLLSGSTMVSGYGQMLVATTGANTEYGKLAISIKATEGQNAFQKGVTKFGMLIVKVIICIVTAIFIINVLMDKGLVNSLIFAIAVAVGVTPELLPMIMSVNMAKGSIKMSHKGVIVKKLDSIPDFGSMDILCTDKTGTLTEDKITLVKHLNPLGQDDEHVLRLAYINSKFEMGIKSPLDAAVLDFENIKLDTIKKLDEIPYDFQRRRSSIVFLENNKVFLATKGAPEEIFKNCSGYLPNDKIPERITAEALHGFHKIYDDLSAQGFRVLGVATKELENKKTFGKQDEENMVFAGFMAFYDPPKLSAKETIAFMKNYGVEIKILTGDSPLVSQKICADLGLEVKGTISGENFDLNSLSEKLLFKKAQENTIFARFSPSQKERIIEILQKNGLTVGYLGDGINDAPSLKKADVGISVDNAVDVAKESADIILMKKGLKELMEGMIEGRKTFGNTMKYIMMGLSSNFGNMFSMIGASLFLPFFPMLPGQILLNNFLYDLSQASLPTDKVDEEYLRKPKHWDMKFIRKFMLVFGPISSLFDFITFFMLYSVFSLQNGSFQAGWFLESLATQTLIVFIIRTRKLFFKSRPSIYLVISALTVIVIGAVIVLSPIGLFFGFNRLPIYLLAVISLIVISYLTLTEIIKYFFYQKLRSQEI